jgi:hypothetical protein
VTAIDLIVIVGMTEQRAPVTTGQDARAFLIAPSVKLAQLIWIIDQGQLIVVGASKR